MARTLTQSAKRYTQGVCKSFRNLLTYLLIINHKCKHGKLVTEHLKYTGIVIVVLYKTVGQLFVIILLNVIIHSLIS